MPHFKSSKVSLFAAVLALAASAASSQAVTLNATGGALADSDGTDNGVSFFLFGSGSGTVQSVNSLTLTGLTHTYVSDLYTSLIFLPDDVNAPQLEAVLFDGLNDGTNFMSNNLNGNYSFSDTALTTLQAAAQPDGDNSVVPSGTYLPSEFYVHGSSPVLDNLTSTFAGADLSAGSFYIYFEDFAEGDAGTLTSASLNLTMASTPEPASLAALGLVGTALIRRRK